MRTSRQASAWFVGLAVLLVASSAEAVPATKVFLNGVPTPVYFNDGDSFRVLAGRLRGTRARLKGFNTLESYGPVHQWGTWTRQELSNYATLGTLNARRGVWRCTSDMKKDFYGRILWDCPDLAVDQVRKGYAHALTVTSQPAAAPLLAAQMEAITAKRGFWAHGVPDFVMTSTHSTTEGWKPYNRLVSSYKGFSKKWKHKHAYRECQTVCVAQSDVSADKVKAFIPTLRANPTLEKALAGLDDEVARARAALSRKRRTLHQAARFLGQRGFDPELVEELLAADLPVIGICRGAQHLAHWLGGDLRKVSGHVGVRHTVSMASGQTREVNSFHEQAPAACPPDCQVLGTSSDGVIEAFVHPSRPLLGLLWHPEREASPAEEDQALFRNFFGV